MTLVRGDKGAGPAAGQRCGSSDGRRRGSTPRPSTRKYRTNRKVVVVLATLTRKTEKTIATVSASSRKITVSVPEKLTIEESQQLRALLKEQEKVAKGQSVDAWGHFFSIPRDRYTL